MEFSIPHVGINAKNKEQALEYVDILGKIFGISQTSENPKGIFCGTQFEIMKGEGRGTNGHIAIQVESVPKAMEELSQRGIHFIKGTEKFAEDGHINFVYFEEELCGFAFHLTE